MVRIALFACLLGLLATAAPADARPAHASWPFWLSRPERHGQRKLPGDFTPVYKTYRNHSRNSEGSGLFSFLHLGGRQSALARHRSRPHAHRGGHKRTSGIFQRASQKKQLRLLFLAMGLHSGLVQVLSGTCASAFAAPFSPARLSDVPALLEVRFAVTEHGLRDHPLITPATTAGYLTRRGRGQVCEGGGRLVGFAVADVRGHRIRALLVRPESVGYGISKRPHQLVLDWYFAPIAEPVWLDMAPGTGTEMFYCR